MINSFVRVSLSRINLILAVLMYFFQAYSIFTFLKEISLSNKNRKVMCLPIPMLFYWLCVEFLLYWNSKNLAWLLRDLKPIE